LNFTPNIHLLQHLLTRISVTQQLAMFDPSSVSCSANSQLRSNKAFD